MQKTLKIDPAQVVDLPLNTIVTFDYMGGKFSSQPGVKQKRAVLVTEVDATTFSGIDFTRYGEFRKFRRDRMSDMFIFGALMPVQTITTK